jgi:hypothetical protein
MLDSRDESLKGFVEPSRKRALSVKNSLPGAAARGTIPLNGPLNGGHLRKTG